MRIRIITKLITMLIVIAVMLSLSVGSVFALADQNDESIICSVGADSELDTVSAYDICLISFDISEVSPYRALLVTVEKGSYYTLPELTYPTYEGVEFGGWDLGKPGDKILINGDTKLKALKKGDYNWKIGDVDRDGDISISDASRLQMYLACICDLDGKSYTGKYLTAREKGVADIDQDHSLSVVDVTLIQMHLSKLKNVSVIGTPYL